MVVVTVDNRVVVRAVWVALVVPVVLTVVAVGLQMSWLGSLPDPVAIHWGTSGAPNGFAVAWSVPVIAGVAGLALPALMAAITLPALRRGAQGPTFRLMAALAAGVTASMAVTSTWSVAVQRGLDRATDAPSILPGMAAGLLAALVVGVGGWLAQPHQRPVAPGAASADPLPLAAGERVMWTRSTHAARWLAVPVTGVALVTGTLAVVFWFTSPATALTLAATTVVVVLAIAGTAAYTVRVDRDGLTVTSALGIPRFQVPLSDISSAGTGDVTGLGEFGGYGIRSAPHATGVILRNGDALRVVRNGGRQFVVTVDDAAIAAALLEGLVAQRRAGAAG